MAARLIKVPPKHFVHIQDINLNTARLLVGPVSYTTKTNEVPSYGPNPFIVVPPNYYVIVMDPIVLQANGEPKLDEHGQVMLHYGREEVRCECDPFPLYPGEQIKGSPIKMPQVAVNSALLLKAQWDLTDRSGKKRCAGDQWLFEGPAVFVPLAGIDILEVRQAIIININQALRVKALYDCCDKSGNERVCGEEWLIKTQGAYILQECEQMVALIDAFVLTPTDALCLEAMDNFTDEKGRKRRIGEQYLISMSDTDSYLPNVHERLIQRVSLISLSKMQYCIVENPIDPETNIPQYGRAVIRRGEQQFFLQPGETLRRNGVFDVIVLGPEEAIYIRALESHNDESEKGSPPRIAGQRWLKRGPCEFVPSLQVKVESLLCASLQLEAIGFYSFYRRVARAGFLQATPLPVQPVVANNQPAAANRSGRGRGGRTRR